MKNSIKKFNIGILSAMPEEIGNILENVEELHLSKYGSLKMKNLLQNELKNLNQVNVLK